MPRHITVVTPENVTIEYELAGLASRTGAAVVDLLIQALAILLAMCIYLAVVLLLHLSVTGWVTGVMIVSSFLLWWGYYVFFETRWNGQTPGKRLLRLRVIKYGGGSVDLASAAIRGLIRIVDLAAVCIGVVVMLVTSRTQRLGDLAAGTLVVKERGEWQGHLAKPKSAMTEQHAEAELVRNIELVTPDQFDTVKRFVERAPELQPHTREQLAVRITVPLMEHLGIENNGRIVHANLLCAIYDKCVSERGMR